MSQSRNGSKAATRRGRWSRPVADRLLSVSRCPVDGDRWRPAQCSGQQWARRSPRRPATTRLAEEPELHHPTFVLEEERLLVAKPSVFAIRIASVAIARAPAAVRGRTLAV